MLYDGNDTIYHLSTGTAAMAGMALKPYVIRRNNPALAGGKQKDIAKKVAMGADDAAGGVEGSTSTLAQYGNDFGKMGTYVENPNIKVDWTQYAEHAAERMQQRGMTQEMVNYIVENGKVLSQNNGNKFAYITQEGVLIISKEGKLITAWSNADFDSSMLEIINKLFGE